MPVEFKHPDSEVIEREFGLCQCGCGERAPISRYTDVGAGYRAGEPRRFIKNHDKRRPHIPTVDEQTGCWNWPACNAVSGYGVMRDPTNSKRQVYAHRHFYEQHKGPIPEGLQIDHLCRNRACVNPEHLEAVTPTVNTRRAAKLSEDAVRHIRRSTEPPEALAERYGVKPGTVKDIRCRPHDRWVGVA